MAEVNKKVTRTYHLDLNEKEFFAVLCLVGGVSHAEFKDYVNRRYSILLGRDEPEDFEVPNFHEYSHLYNMLDNNK